MLKLGENIKKFRLKSDLTQEQLADVIGVSAQAVSRWENGTTYPDITLLPTIANYFEITIDELMGMEDFKSEEQIKELLAKIDENSNKGLIYENILFLREAVKIYPRNYELLLKLIRQLTFCSYKNGTPLTENEQLELNHEAVGIGERILSSCTDMETIIHTRDQMCYAYFKLGEKEKAVEYAKKLPNMWLSDTMALCDVLEGEAREIHLKQTIKSFVSGMWLTMWKMADYEYKYETMTPAKRIAIMKKALSLLELVFEDDDYLNYSGEVVNTHKMISDMAMLENDYELALSSLEKAAEYAIIEDTLPEEAKHTSLLLEGLDWCAHYTIKNYECTNCKILYNQMQWDRYDPIREKERFIAILDKIKEYC